MIDLVRLQAETSRLNSAKENVPGLLLLLLLYGDGIFTLAFLRRLKHRGRRGFCGFLGFLLLFMLFLLLLLLVSLFLLGLAGRWLGERRQLLMNSFELGGSKTHRKHKM